jgi:polyisoprenyl-phosphate glycosyltransferase
MTSVRLSIVVSVFNEEEMTELFWKEISSTMVLLQEIKWELIFVNDGSTDNTVFLLDELSKNTDNVKVIHLSRNFGHESAMLAGISHSSGDAIICMDADLQHPPSYLPEMITAFINGAEIVTMKKINRKDDGLLAGIASKLFYSLINTLSKNNFEPDASDFFLISGRVAGIITEQFAERTRFLRGLIQIVGFRKVSLDYVSPERHAGKSKYSLYRLLLLSFSAFASFSHIPLRLGLGIGFLFGIFSFSVGIYSLIMHFHGNPVSGYTSIIVLLSFGFSLLFIIIGIIGEYIGFMFSEVKKRPLYIIDRISKRPSSGKNHVH